MIACKQQEFQQAAEPIPASNGRYVVDFFDMGGQHVLRGAVAYTSRRAAEEDACYVVAIDPGIAFSIITQASKGERLSQIPIPGSLS